MYTAIVDKHSVSPSGAEVITFITRQPKSFDAEIEKHRMLSTNSSSSRAVPFHRSFDRGVFVPKDIRKQEKGMQGYTQLVGDDLRDVFTKLEDLGADVYDVINSLVAKYEIHKQHANRYLEPWLFQDKIWTGNVEWFDYFYGLRTAEDADPGIQIIANLMKEAQAKSKPMGLQPGEWHLPLIKEDEYVKYSQDVLKAISSARCARISYSSHDGQSSVDRDIEFAKWLWQQEHRTPFEHQLTPMEKPYLVSVNNIKHFPEWEEGVTSLNKYGSFMSGNIAGWIQNRQLS